MPRILRSFCVGHLPPLFHVPIDFQMLCPSSLGMENEIVIDDNRFGMDVDGASLAEYSQLFALAQMLSSGEMVADDLFLFQYRKFLSPNHGGSQSTASWVRVLTADESGSIFPSAEQLDTLASRVIVGSLLNLSESIPSSYAKMHVIDDFVMFVAACAKNKYLSEADIKGFSTLQGMIPSPALCYINSALFVKIMEILKETWDCYYRSYQIKRTGYQRRVAGYLMERLHSYLLCKWLMDNSEPDIRLWQRYVVLNSDLKDSQVSSHIERNSTTSGSANAKNSAIKIVENYKIVADIPQVNDGHQFSGNSAASKYIVEYLFPDDNNSRKTVLDIGFGSGSLGLLINQSPKLRNWVVDGIDGFQETCFNEPLFRKGIYRNIWHGLAQDLTPEQLCSYDVICLLDVIEHLSPELATNLLTALLASLGDESRLVISTPLWFYPQDQQKGGDLEEHLIGVPIKSMMDLQPIMYCIGTVALVGNFVFTKKSLEYIDKFKPTTDKSFSIQKGLEQVQSMGLNVDNKVYYL